MDKPVENDHVFTSTQELRVDGHHLIEKKQNSLRHDNGIETALVLVHERTIDDKSYKVTVIWQDLVDCDCSDQVCNIGDWLQDFREIETDMTENEIRKFEEDWTSLWNPEITKNEIEKLHHQFE